MTSESVKEYGNSEIKLKEPSVYSIKLITYSEFEKSQVDEINDQMEFEKSEK